MPQTNIHGVSTDYRSLLKDGVRRRLTQLSDIPPDITEKGGEAVFVGATSSASTAADRSLVAAAGRGPGPADVQRPGEPSPQQRQRQRAGDLAGQERTSPLHPCEPLAEMLSATRLFPASDAAGDGGGGGGVGGGAHASFDASADDDAGDDDETNVTPDVQPWPSTLGTAASAPPIKKQRHNAQRQQKPRFEFTDPRSMLAPILSMGCNAAALALALAVDGGGGWHAAVLNAIGAGLAYKHSGRVFEDCFSPATVQAAAGDDGASGRNTAVGQRGNSRTGARRGDNQPGNRSKDDGVAAAKAATDGLRQRRKPASATSVSEKKRVARRSGSTGKDDQRESESDSSSDRGTDITHDEVNHEIADDGARYHRTGAFTAVAGDGVAGSGSDRVADALSTVIEHVPVSLRALDNGTAAAAAAGPGPASGAAGADAQPGHQRKSSSSSSAPPASLNASVSIEIASLISICLTSLVTWSRVGLATGQYPTMTLFVTAAAGTSLICDCVAYYRRVEDDDTTDAAVKVKHRDTAAGEAEKEVRAGSVAVGQSSPTDRLPAPIAKCTRIDHSYMPSRFQGTAQSCKDERIAGFCALGLALLCIGKVIPAWSVPAASLVLGCVSIIRSGLHIQATLQWLGEERASHVFALVGPPLWLAFAFLFSGCCQYGGLGWSTAAAQHTGVDPLGSTAGAGSSAATEGGSTGSSTGMLSSSQPSTHWPIFNIPSRYGPASPHPLWMPSQEQLDSGRWLASGPASLLMTAVILACALPVAVDGLARSVGLAPSAAADSPAAAGRVNGSNRRKSGKPWLLGPPPRPFGTQQRADGDAMDGGERSWFASSPSWPTVTQAAWMWSLAFFCYSLLSTLAPKMLPVSALSAVPYLALLHVTAGSFRHLTGCAEELEVALSDFLTTTSTSSSLTTGEADEDQCLAGSITSKGRTEFKTVLDSMLPLEQPFEDDDAESAAPSGARSD